MARRGTLQPLDPAPSGRPSGRELLGRALGLPPPGPDPAQLFDALATGQPLGVPVQVIGRPGEALARPPEVGDVYIRRARGEGRLAHVAVIADAQLREYAELGDHGLEPEASHPGWYLHVIEAGPFGRRRADRFARRVLHPSRRLSADAVVVRPVAARRPSLGLEGGDEAAGPGTALPPCRSRCGDAGPQREAVPPATPPLVYRTGDPNLLRTRALRPAVGYAQVKLNEFLARHALGHEPCPGLADPAARTRFEALRAQLSRGNHLCEDCFFWDDTDRATRMFQLCRGLLEDGKIGPNTWAALETNPVVPVPPIIIDASCPPTWTATRLQAASIDEYIALVECVERSFPSSTPREILSLVRQIYYGDVAWSRTRRSQWTQVITCGHPLADPRSTLGKTYDALQTSQVVTAAGFPATDLGHVFTGLEAMACPTATVDLIPLLGPLGRVSMSNEDVATWGGDIGSAAAKRVNDEQDRGLAPKPWSAYIGSRGGPASAGDLRGDIDPFVIRAALTGNPCATSTMKALTLGMPLSQVLDEYYNGLSTAVGRARAGRFRCFAEALGATVSGRRITNKAALSSRLSRSVESFAWAFYLGAFNKTGALQGRFPAVQIASIRATAFFLDWLEARL